ncbi:unannotated protein [freshwater metagenome]|uniref:Unannotated protein n=1 Tax=freshwater metagenome TaxID=449393 RepID=A0A6J6X383_9ZZZZ
MVRANTPPSKLIAALVPRPAPIEIKNRPCGTSTYPGTETVVVVGWVRLTSTMASLSGTAGTNVEGRYLLSVAAPNVVAPVGASEYGTYNTPD